MVLREIKKNAAVLVEKCADYTELLSIISAVPPCGADCTNTGYCHDNVSCSITRKVKTCSSCPNGFTGNGVNCTQTLNCTKNPCFPLV